jgi:hypothetical protein
MQSEEFDKKVTEAADHHHPAYDENAWARMEKLLDKHLPQKKDDRRRIIFFLLFFLLLGGAAWLLISKPWKENNRMATVKAAIQQSGDETSIPVSAKEGNIKENNVELINKKDINPGIAQHNQVTIMAVQPNRQTAVTNDRINKKDKTGNRLQPAISKKKTINDKPGSDFSGNTKLTDTDNKNNRQGNSPVDAEKTNKPILAITSDQKNKNKEPASDYNSLVPNNTKTNIAEPAGNENKNNTELLQNPSLKKVKNKEKKTNSFFFALSAGPDFSAAGGDKIGKTRILTGAGLGYIIKDRLTIRTGFYTGRKIYTASPDSYHAPAGFYIYYPNLEKVDANCKVYEIPLSLSYNFGHSAKQHWFVSTGLSSYLMKKETYNYFYKYNAAGPTLSKQWTIQDQNKHYFSVLTLSGGYQKNIGKNISLIVEPYIKLPLSGVGYGKVKLNSGGLLFSVGIKPFNNSKNHIKPSH